MSEKKPPPTPPLITRDDIPKEPLPDNSKQQAALNSANGGLRGAKQALARATATMLPALSMDKLSQMINSATNSVKCN